MCLESGIRLACSAVIPSTAFAALNKPLVAAPELEPWALLAGGLALLAAARLARNRRGRKLSPPGPARAIRFH